MRTLKDFCLERKMLNIETRTVQMRREYVRVTAL